MQTQSDPYTTRHRRIWRFLRRWCTCGARWPCPDSHTPVRPTTPVAPAAPQWSTAPTELQPFVGQAPNLTRAAQWRSNSGGRWS